MNWYFKVLRQYTDFNGRARRKEYWIFLVVNAIFAAIAVVLDHILGLNHWQAGNFSFGIIYLAYALLLVIPSLAVLVRRLHDVGKSGWWIFIHLVPIIGSIWFLILTLLDSQSGSNKYGSNPKA